jgi:hypothetical protein
MIPAIALPLFGRAAPGDPLLVNERGRALWRVLLAALDHLVPPADPTREPAPPPEWYKYPPF